MSFGEGEKLGEATKEEYLKRMQFARAGIFKEDFSVRLSKPLLVSPLTTFVAHRDGCS